MKTEVCVSSVTSYMWIVDFIFSFGMKVPKNGSLFPFLTFPFFGLPNEFLLSSAKFLGNLERAEFFPKEQTLVRKSIGGC